MHQIVLTVTRNVHDIAVSCTCRAPRDPIEVRPRWDSGEAYRVWREHEQAATERSAA